MKFLEDEIRKLKAIVVKHEKRIRTLENKLESEESSTVFSNNNKPSEVEGNPEEGGLGADEV